MENLRPNDPHQVGAYRLLARLGAGGMGSVFLGRAPSGRTVAVKFVHAELARDADFRRRFRQEVEAARRVSGPWTAPVLDADTDSETPWVATGYVAGPTLQETVAELYGPLPERSVRALAAGLAEALREIHDRDVIHRDLKPSNVMLTLDGPRVIDFGIARAGDGSVLTGTGMVVGTPGFMPPEQVRGERVTAAGDVFSLGAVLAYAATGRHPFGSGEGGAAALLYRVVNEPPDLDGMTGELRDLAERCMAKDPGGRPSPAEIAAAVEVPDASGSWLPGGVVEAVGRRAVELLDLERGDERPGPGVRGAVGAPPTAPPTGYAGPFAPGRRSTVVLVMVAVAALSFGLFFVVAVRSLGTDGEGERRAQGTTDPAPEPTWSAGGAPSPRDSVETSSPSPSGDGTVGTAGAGDVPERFLGTWTWEGETTDGGPVSQRVVVTQGPRGGDVMEVTTTGSGSLCVQRGELTEAAPHVIELSVRDVRSVGAGGDCSGPPTRRVFSVQEDGTLKRGAGPYPRIYRKVGE
ncbi:serine/threonine-protein kinase [Actinomadura sediminis]|uniref:Serine/threonine-protein kinase n=1 Tax=Actinomadura sediminis TaxID=1038904 RepID=A0ABW3EPZ9_9ACTN